MGPACAPAFAGFFSAGGDVLGLEAALAAPGPGPACAPGFAGVFCAGGVAVVLVCAHATGALVATTSAAAPVSEIRRMAR